MRSGYIIGRAEGLFITCFVPCYRQLDHFFTMTAVNQENHHYRYFQHVRGSNQRLWYSYYDELDSAKMH
jgi:hypothetical protein